MHNVSLYYRWATKSSSSQHTLNSFSWAILECDEFNLIPAGHWRPSAIWPTIQFRRMAPSEPCSVKNFSTVQKLETIHTNKILTIVDAIISNSCLAETAYSYSTVCASPFVSTINNLWKLQTMFVLHWYKQKRSNLFFKLC